MLCRPHSNDNCPMLTCVLGRLEERIEDLTALVRTVIQNQQTQGELMATIDEKLTAIDAATTAAGQRVDALIASIKASGQTLTPAQQAEADAIVSHLTGIAADPANPVPAVTPPTPITPAT